MSLNRFALILLAVVTVIPNYAQDFPCHRKRGFLSTFNPVHSSPSNLNRRLLDSDTQNGAKQIARGKPAQCQVSVFGSVPLVSERLRDSVEGHRVYRPYAGRATRHQVLAVV